MSADTHRFEAVYRATYDQITAYAGRRCDSPQDAADVVAETFVIVWRKIDELPPGAEARLWVYGVARNVLARTPSVSGSTARRRLSRALEGADVRFTLTDAVLPTGTSL
ncbi:sigma factor [Nonomuraea sp. NPDC049625]|uniref:RNA polymerase sigma factor n=1 Tax=Nonomuraea sp. NPDC049625 TaxID=3155775 RepID=UPI0034281984